MTINSKQIKNTNIKALKYLKEEDKELNRWEKKVQVAAGKISDILSKLPFLWRIQLFDDLEMFSIKYSLECLVDRVWRIVSFKQLRYQFKNGLSYFRRGFKSHDFDSFHALNDFVWKLDRLEKVISDNDTHYGADKDGKDIREVVRLLKRVMDDDYLDEFEAQVSEKYGDNIRYEARTDGVFGMLNKDKGPFKSGNVGVMIRNIREKWTPKLDKEIDKAEMAMYRKADNKRKREWKKALSIIEENFFGWWD